MSGIWLLRIYKLSQPSEFCALLLSNYNILAFQKNKVDFLIQKFQSYFNSKFGHFFETPKKSNVQ